ncbi:MAG: PVC-type heme-binding CxxCH protein [Phycisphaeraceae bacterium]
MLIQSRIALVALIAFLSSPALAAARPPMAQGLSPDAAAKAMTLPEGFKVTLFAGEPDVVQPIAMALDDRGRVWVAEAYSYPRKVAEADAKDRILIFEDVDGDGKFDKRTVFADKLNLISGIEVGFGGVWVGAAPQLLFIPDKNNDDVPDGPPVVIRDGFGSQDTHETLNAFIWGPDGWLYGCNGVFTHSKVGKPGAPDSERIPMNAAIWRYHPTKDTFEIFAEGGSNQWGVDFNDQGQAFMTACVIPHLYHVIQGARYQRQGGQHFNKYVYDDIKTIARHRHFVGGQWTAADRERSDSVGGGHAHAGAMVYLGGAWPEKYRNQIFMNNIHGARINQDQLARKGSGYEGDAAPDFCFANDKWSQIINLRYGPDGQVYMIDWYDKNECHHKDVNSHDRTNGRIFKVNYGETKAVKVDLKKLSNTELIALQTNRNDWYVRHARRILQERAAAGQVKEEVYGQTLAITSNIPSTEIKLRALWAAHVTGKITEQLTLALLSSGSEYEKAWAIQLACEDGKPGEKALAKFAELAKDDKSPVVRLYLASALQRLPLEQRWAIAEALIAHEGDADDHNLPLMYWYAIEPLVGGEPKKGVLLAAKAKIPILRQYITRRVIDANKPPPPVLPEPDKFKVKDALEGESLKVLSVTGGKANPQKMHNFTLDRWSGADQLWWTGGKVGDKLTLALPVANAGKHEVQIVLTKATDYAIVQVWLDDRKLGDPIDCYNNGVITTGVLKLDALELKAGEHRLTIEITGANAKAAKAYMVGVDYVRLEGK